MTPLKFKECNASYGPPEGLVESQVRTIWAYHGTVEGGSMEGSRLVVVAYKPTPEEIKQIVDGAPIFLTACGGLMPHFLSLDFQNAVSVA